jgi:hypothetical protein
MGGLKISEWLLSFEVDDEDGTSDYDIVIRV